MGAGTNMFVEMCIEMKSLSAPTVVGEYAGFKMAVAMADMMELVLISCKFI